MEKLEANFFSQPVHNVDFDKKLTQNNVSDPCMKKSMDAMIIVEPMILDDMIVINLALSTVSTPKIIAPPTTATTTSFC